VCGFIAVPVCSTSFPGWPCHRDDATDGQLFARERSSRRLHIWHCTSALKRSRPSGHVEASGEQGACHEDRYEAHLGCDRAAPQNSESGACIKVEQLSERLIGNRDGGEICFETGSPLLTDRGRDLLSINKIVAKDQRRFGTDKGRQRRSKQGYAIVRGF
jgi:hypothetical protein